MNRCVSQLEFTAEHPGGQVAIEGARAARAGLEALSAVKLATVTHVAIGGGPGDAQAQVGFTLRVRFAFLRWQVQLRHGQTEGHDLAREADHARDAARGVRQRGLKLRHLLEFHAIQTRLHPQAKVLFVVGFAAQERPQSGHILFKVAAQFRERDPPAERLCLPCGVELEPVQGDVAAGGDLQAHDVQIEVRSLCPSGQVASGERDLTDNRTAPAGTAQVQAGRSARLGLTPRERPGDGSRRALAVEGQARGFRVDFGAAAAIDAKPECGHLERCAQVLPDQVRPSSQVRQQGQIRLEPNLATETLESECTQAQERYVADQPVVFEPQGACVRSVAEAHVAAHLARIQAQVCIGAQLVAAQGHIRSGTLKAARSHQGQLQVLERVFELAGKRPIHERDGTV